MLKREIVRRRMTFILSLSLLTSVSGSGDILSDNDHTHFESVNQISGVSFTNSFPADVLYLKWDSTNWNRFMIEDAWQLCQDQLVLLMVYGLKQVM